MIRTFLYMSLIRHFFHDNRDVERWYALQVEFKNKQLQKINFISLFEYDNSFLRNKEISCKKCLLVQALILSMNINNCAFLFHFV